MKRTKYAVSIQSTASYIKVADYALNYMIGVNHLVSSCVSPF